MTLTTYDPPPPTLTVDQIDDLIYFARAGETADFKETLFEFAKKYNRYEIEILAAAIDEDTGNGCLHMAGGNGHLDICTYILSLSSPTDATAPDLPPTEMNAPPPSKYLTKLANHPNGSLNTPLHWACLNGHLSIVKLLLEKGDANPGALNAAGHDAIYEAELADKSDVVEWVLGYGEMLEGVGFIGGAGEDDEKENGEGGSTEVMNGANEKTAAKDIGDVEESTPEDATIGQKMEGLDLEATADVVKADEASKLETSEVQLLR